MSNKEMPPAWGRGFELRKELKEQKTLVSLLFNAKREIERKKTKQPLLETPQDVFESMQGKNEIGGDYAPFEFLKVEGNDLVISITDIHGDREILKQVLDYIKERKNNMQEGDEVHLVYGGDIALGTGNEDIECLFDLLKANKNGDFQLHYLKGNAERDSRPVKQLKGLLTQQKEDFGSFPQMTNYFNSLPSALFLKIADDKTLLFNHSILPMVNKKRFEKEGLGVYNHSAQEIDKLGVRESLAMWGEYDGEKQKGELGGEKIAKIGKESFETITDRLNIDEIFRGHDSNLIKEKAKEIGVYVEQLENNKNVYTFHTSRKATGDFGVFVEIDGDGEVKFKKVTTSGVADENILFSDRRKADI